MKTLKKMTALTGTTIAMGMLFYSCSKEDSKWDAESQLVSEAESVTALEPESQVALASEAESVMNAESQEAQTSEPSMASGEESDTISDVGPDDNDSDCESLEEQLEAVRKLAMPFHSFEQAKKAGYADPSPFNPSPYVPNMGFHYTNGSLLDGTFELEKPEILLYVPNAQGKLKLVGVEYAVPGPPDSTPPEGFIGDEDHWHYNPMVAGGAWTLHVWVVEENPDGIFAELNPNVPKENPAEDCEVN